VERSDDRDVEESRPEQPTDAHGAGGRDVDEVRALGLEQREDAGRRREAELDAFVAGERERPLRLEAQLTRPDAARGCDDGQRQHTSGGSREPPHRAGDAVDLVQRVGEDECTRLVSHVREPEEGVLDLT